MDSENTGKAKLTLSARKNVNGILDYLFEERPSAAHEFHERLQACRELLAMMPMLGRIPRSTRMLRKGYRCYVMDDYSLFYKVVSGRVDIYHVVHNARKPPE